MTARVSFFLVASFLIASSSLAREQRQLPKTVGPSALNSHAARIEHEAVEDLKADRAGSPWSVDLDMVFPIDKAEYEALGKYVILVFALFSNDQTELPLSGAYVGGTPLKCLRPVPRDVPPASATAKAFGKFRSDTLCVLPMDLERAANSVKIDFAKNHKGLDVSYHFITSEEPDFVKADIDPQPLPMPDPVILEKIIAREYPGFGFRVR